MSLPAYPKYKNSGVDWLGFVPETWKIRPIKSLARGPETLFMDGDWIESRNICDDGIRYITTGNVGAGTYKEQGSGFISEKTFCELNCTEVLPGDVLISRLNAPIGRSCIVPDLGSRIVTSVDNVIVRPCEEVERRFLVYRLSSPDYFHETGNIASGATMQRISRTELGNIRLAIPPIDEQFAIAAFLDHETYKIDTLIAEQEKLLTLLAEKRQATISHAVTHGLDPNAPMKDSGVAWLGEVPAHWGVKKVGYDCNVLSGFAFPSAGFSLDDGDVKLLRGVNVGVGALRWNEVVYWNRVADDGLDAFELRPGDIVLGMDRPWISEGLRVARVSENDTPCLLLQRVATIRPNTKLNADYLYYLFRAGYFFHHCAPEMTGVSVPHISPEQIRSFVVPVPPVNEQSDIAAFVEAECTKLDALDVEARHSIDLLKERRSALIAAAVTGKIDVRNSVPEELAA